MKSLMLMMTGLNTTASEGGKIEEKKIKKAVADYIEGYYLGDEDRIANALHPELVKRIPQISKENGARFLQPISRLDLIKYTKAGFGKLKPNEKINLKIDKIDIFEDVAMAKASSVHFMDYVHLVKWNEDWKVINVIWQYQNQ